MLAVAVFVLELSLDGVGVLVVVAACVLTCLEAVDLAAILQVAVLIALFVLIVVYHSHGSAFVGNVNVSVGGAVVSRRMCFFGAVTKHVGLVSAAGLTEEKVDELVAVLCVSIGLDEGVCLSSRSGNAHGNEHSNYHNESKHERKCLFHCCNPFLKLDW